MDPPQDSTVTSLQFVNSSPGGKSRYGRTRRPKISQDFFNIDDVVLEDRPMQRHSPIKSPKLKASPKPPIVSTELLFDIKEEFTKLDDLEMKVANNFKTNLQRGLDDSIKERKFFKSVSDSKVVVPNAVDVTKVLKLISTKPQVSEICESKALKSPLKTYSNKRKHINDSDSFVVESFGLPDNPIIPMNSPRGLERNTRIDVDAKCKVDVNLKNPWVFEDFDPLPLYACDPINRKNMGGFLGSNKFLNVNPQLDTAKNGQENTNYEKSRIHTLPILKKLTPETTPKQTKTPPVKKKRKVVVSTRVLRSSFDNNNVDHFVNITSPAKTNSLNVTTQKDKDKSLQVLTSVGHNADPSLVLNPFSRKDSHLTNLDSPQKTDMQIDSEKTEIKIKQEVDVENIKTECIEFEVGDLAWAKIGSYPFWPCLVTQEPISKDYKKYVVKRVNPLYHVRFFGDSGRRSWVTSTHLMLYFGPDDLEKIAKTVKPENKTRAAFIKEAYFIKPLNLAKWRIGVNEAESLKHKSVDERLNYFYENYDLPGTTKRRSKHIGLKKGVVSKNDVENANSKKRAGESKDDNEPKKIKLDSLINDSDIKIKEEILELYDEINESPQKETSQENTPTEGKSHKITRKSYDYFLCSVTPGSRRLRSSQDENTKMSSIPKNLLKDFNKSRDKKKYLKEEIYSEEALEARKKLRNSYIKIQPENSQSPPKGVEDNQTLKKRNSTDENSEQEEKDSKIRLHKTKKRNSIEDSVEQENAQKTEKSNSTDENCELEEKDSKIRLQKNKKRFSTEDTSDQDSKISKKTPQNGETVNSDTDSKFSDNSSVAPTFESQAALYKRNNIFRGVPREKVCQICEEGGEIFKCKGPCNGVYHYKCALNSIPAKENEPEVEIRKVVKTEKIEKQSNVEIVAIECKKPLPNISETSPAYTAMSLAEKIDFRMKEIMKKVDNQSVYAESTDSSSEELPVDDTKKPISKLQITATKTPTKKEVPIIKHVTADHVSYICISNEEKADEKDVNEVVRDNSKNLKCTWCSTGDKPPCLVCNENESETGSNFRQKCYLHQCGRYYHPECLKLWPQTQWSLTQSTKDKKSDFKYDSFVCPRHVCHTCIADDIQTANTRLSSDKIVKCLRCPATYHSSNSCVPAGSHILTNSQIICPRHYKFKKKNMPQTINANWCFLCAKGGNLICCETCPTSVHLECLPGDFNKDDTFYCEDCQSGRLPLYDEIVWVKLGSFRWWPALILFPNEIPDNVKNIAHNLGEFVVKFYGTYDHYWINRGRTFLFQEGDKGQCRYAKRRFDNAYIRAIEEAEAAHHLKRQFKVIKAAEKNNGIKPPPYIRIKVNKPVGNVRLLDGNTSNTTSCDCDPNQPHPCGPDSDCLNRLLLTECNPEICPAGNRCNNQRFEKREYPPLVPHRTELRGWGLKTLAPIRKGQFVIEYVGEVIDEQEYQRRIQKMHEQKEENYYFLTIDKDRTLDAGPKGNVARFMNHSCQPNCETQKWTVNGHTRVGLFANCDIPADTELTFNYNLECIGKEKKICKCGAPNCSGFIGVKVKSDVVPKKTSKPKKKKILPLREEVISENFCFICGKSGDVGACNNKICTKFYHLNCVGLESWPEGNKWVCQWHNCNFCTKRTIRCCVMCVNSYCPSHSEGNVRYDKLLGFVCSEHDPMKEVTILPNIENVSSDKILTEDGAVSSTTPNVEDDLNNSVRVNGCITSTPLKKSPDNSQDEPLASVVKPKVKKAKNNKKKDMKNTAILYNSLQNEVKLSQSTPVKYLRTSRNSNRTDPDKDLPIRKRNRLRCENTL